MRRGGFSSVPEIVEKLSKRFGFERDLKVWKLRKVWVRRFGRFSRFVMPEDYRRNVVYLHTESPVWKTELTYLKKEILDILSSEVDFPIKDVVVKVAPFREWEDIE